MNLVRTVIAVLVGLALAGCVSLLPKTKAAQLYRFTMPVAAAARPASGERFNVSFSPADFDRASAGDRILTVRGDTTAYIAGARWVSNANVLFEQAVESAFAADAGPANLLASGEPAHADYSLKLDVRAFEARYAGAPIPTVHVVLYAALVSAADHTDRERTFAADVPAAENRVGAIARAYTAATAQVTTALAHWVDTRGAG